MHAPQILNSPEITLFKHIYMYKSPATRMAGHRNGQWLRRTLRRPTESGSAARPVHAQHTRPRLEQGQLRGSRSTADWGGQASAPPPAPASEPPLDAETGTSPAPKAAPPAPLSLRGFWTRVSAVLLCEQPVQRCGGHGIPLRLALKGGNPDRFQLESRDEPR